MLLSVKRLEAMMKRGSSDMWSLIRVNGWAAVKYSSRRTRWVMSAGQRTRFPSR
jgi:hypothetical protein